MKSHSIELLITFVTLSTFIVISCKKPNHSISKSDCDTSQVRYVTCVKAILDKYCVGCHKTGNTSGYVNLDSYLNAKPFGINGNLYGSCQHLDGNVAMPPNGLPKLDSMNLFLIRKWCISGCLE
jgi:hypothetical protein